MPTTSILVHTSSPDYLVRTIDPPTATVISADWPSVFPQHSGSVGVSLALVVPSVLGVLYLLLWQSYVLR